MSLFADAPSIVAADGVRPEPQLFTFRHDASGKFVAAVAALKAGTTVFEEVGEVKSLPDKYTLQLDDGQHMLCAGPLIFCNHSCEPNCKAQVEYGLVRMIAVKQINAGDPITFDYNTTEWDMASPFDCICGASNCKKRVAGFKNLTPAQKVDIDRALMSPFILEKATQPAKQA